MLKGKLVNASASPHPVVCATAQALEALYGSWNASELQKFKWTAFRLSSVANGFVTREDLNCDPEDDPRDCLLVATLPLQLDSDRETQWLAVVTLPAAAFHRTVQDTIFKVNRTVDAIDEESLGHVEEARLVGLGVLVVMLMISAALALCLGCLVRRPLRLLSMRMARLGSLDFDRKSGKVREFVLEESSRIRDVAKLQHAFWSLSRGTDAFSRFIPETVVHHIVRGDRHATGLHVSRREVTIMFMFIRDADDLSQKLPQEDLLQVLTRFFFGHDANR
jgi:hypothetical protein